jgi:hypothetical protein
MRSVVQSSQWANDFLTFCFRIPKFLVTLTVMIYTSGLQTSELVNIYGLITEVSRLFKNKF